MFAHGLNYTRHLSICNVAVNLGYSVFCPTDAVKTAAVSYTHLTLPTN